MNKIICSVVNMYIRQVSKNEKTMCEFVQIAFSRTGGESVTTFSIDNHPKHVHSLLKDTLSLVSVLSVKDNKSHEQFSL